MQISRRRAYGPDRRPVRPLPPRKQTRYRRRSVVRRARFASLILRTATTYAFCHARASTFSTRRALILGCSSCPAHVRSADTVSSQKTKRYSSHPFSLTDDDGDFWQTFKRWRRCLLVVNRRSGARRNPRASRGTCCLQGAVTDTGWRMKIGPIRRFRWLPNAAMTNWISIDAPADWWENADLCDRK